MSAQSSPDPELAHKGARRRRRPKPGRWLSRRLNESVSTVRGVIAQPRAVPSQLREALLKIWRTRGGGFYGFGYVVAFVVLEVRAFIGNFEVDGDVATMLMLEALQFVFRFAAQSLLNGFIAFGWPIFVVDLLGGWGLVTLAAAWFVFDRWAHPWLDSKLPRAQGQTQPEADS